MKILRIFIDDYNLNETVVNWLIVEYSNLHDAKISGVTVDSGASTFAELAEFEEHLQLEVYLSASFCSVFKVNVSNISTRKLNEELILGLIEDQLADDIEMVKPVILRTEDDIAYVAVFERQFYSDLLTAVTALNKPIRFLQSFVYATSYQENSWTLYLDKNRQNFIRTSKYEYFLLDDNLPLPTILQQMLTQTKNLPEKILIYAALEDDIATQLKQQYNIKAKMVNNDFTFGMVIWNFYNQRSVRFQLKLLPNTLVSIFNLAKVLKYFVAAVVVIWSVQMLNLIIHDATSKKQLKQQLALIDPTLNIDKQANVLTVVHDKLLKLRHEHGVYDANDGLPMLHTFLSIVSAVGQNDITQITYNQGELAVFLTAKLPTGEFDSYQHIFLAKNIKATLTDYKSYSKQIKTNNAQSGDNSAEVNKLPDVSADTAWVIHTLRL